MGRYDAALAKLERAAAIDIGPVDPYLLCREHYFFARVFFKKGVLDRAVEHAEQCVHLARECGAENEVANGLMIFADIAAAQRDQHQELTQREFAFEIFQRIGAPQADQVRERIAALKRRRPTMTSTTCGTPMAASHPPPRTAQWKRGTPPRSSWNCVPGLLL
jgi:hypothetical protein